MMEGRSIHPARETRRVHRQVREGPVPVVDLSATACQTARRPRGVVRMAGRPSVAAVRQKHTHSLSVIVNGPASVHGRGAALHTTNTATASACTDRHRPEAGTTVLGWHMHRPPSPRGWHDCARVAVDLLLRGRVATETRWVRLIRGSIDSCAASSHHRFLGGAGGRRNVGLRGARPVSDSNNSNNNSNNSNNTTTTATSVTTAATTTTTIITTITTTAATTITTTGW